MIRSIPDEALDKKEEVHVHSQVVRKTPEVVLDKRENQARIQSEALLWLAKRRTASLILCTTASEKDRGY